MQKTNSLQYCHPQDLHGGNTEGGDYVGPRDSNLLSLDLKPETLTGLWRHSIAKPTVLSRWDSLRCVTRSHLSLTLQAIRWALKAPMALAPTAWRPVRMVSVSLMVCVTEERGRLCVFVYKYVHIYIDCACVWLCNYVPMIFDECGHAYVHVCLYVCVICVYVVHTYAHVCVCVYVCVCVCVLSVCEYMHMHRSLISSHVCKHIHRYLVSFRLCMGMHRALISSQASFL